MERSQNHGKMGGGIKEGGLGTQRGDELRFPILRDYFECASTAFIMTRFRFAFVSGRARAVLATSDYQMKSYRLHFRNLVFLLNLFQLPEKLLLREHSLLYQNLAERINLHA